MIVGQVTSTAIDEMFEAARAIMRWFGECAKVCSHFFQRLFYLLLYSYNSL